MSSQLQNQPLPSLFDRLTDEEPHKGEETHKEQAINLKQYRKAVFRDVLFLLNTCNMQTSMMNTDLSANVRSPTLNYGIPPISGINFSDIEWEDIEQYIKQAIIDFEPRLNRHLLQIMIHTEDKDNNVSYNKSTIEIKGDLKLNPYPEEFLSKVSIDVETGSFNLLDETGGHE